MKIILLFISLVAIGITVWHFIYQGLDDILWLLPGGISGFLSLYYIIHYGSDNFISHYFRRKSLEEKKKISELNKKD